MPDPLEPSVAVGSGVRELPGPLVGVAVIVPVDVGIGVVTNVAVPVAVGVAVGPPDGVGDSVGMVNGVFVIVGTGVVDPLANGDGDGLRVTVKSRLGSDGVPVGPRGGIVP